MSNHLTVAGIGMPVQSHIGNIECTFNHVLQRESLRARRTLSCIHIEKIPEAREEKTIRFTPQISFRATKNVFDPAQWVSSVGFSCKRMGLIALLFDLSDVEN